MTSQKPTGMSPFALTYEIEVIIPTEIGMATLQTKILEEANVEALTKDLDMTNDQVSTLKCYNKPLLMLKTQLTSRWEVPTKLGRAIHRNSSGSS